MNWRLLVALFIGLAAANFFWQQLFSDQPDIDKAIERTFFQGVALVSVWLASIGGNQS